MKRDLLLVVSLVVLLVALTGCKTVRFWADGHVESAVPPVLENDQSSAASRQSTGADNTPVLLELLDHPICSPWDTGNPWEVQRSPQAAAGRTVFPPFPAVIVWQIPEKL